MAPTRRQYLTGATALLSAAGLGSTALAQENSAPIAFDHISPEGEYIIIRNVSGEEVDLSGYNVNLEVGQQIDQIPDEPFPEGTTLPADETLTIITGEAASREGDINLGYQRAMINNTDPDTIGIINPDGEVVIRTDNESHFVSDTTTTTQSADEQPTTTEDPTEEPTDTPTETPAEEPTQTTTDTPTETTTAEPTQEPTDTPTQTPAETTTETPTQDPTQTPSEQTPVDSDCDGLTNAEEKRLGTDPNDTDSDGDGWSDLSEVNRGHNPLNSSDHP